MSEQPREQVRRLPSTHPFLKAGIVGIIGAIVDTATGPELFKAIKVATIVGFPITIGVIVAVVLLSIWIAWEEWYIG